MSDATFATPDLSKFCRLDELGLEVIGQRVEPDRALLACRVRDPDDWCHHCGEQGVARDTVQRRLAHEPFGWRPTTLLVTVHRYRCTGCGRVWRQDTTKAAPARAKISRAGLRWALEGLVLAHLTVARVAEGLAVAWDTANDAVLAEGKRVLIEDPDRFAGVAVLGVDEHVWRHTRKGDKYVTVIIDLTPIRDGTGPATGCSRSGAWAPSDRTSSTSLPAGLVVEPEAHLSRLHRCQSKWSTSSPKPSKTIRNPTRLGHTRLDQVAEAEDHVAMPEPWLSADDIAAYLGVTKDTVYAWIAEKGMPAHKVGRLWKFQASEVDEWVRSGSDASSGDDLAPGAR